MRSQSPLLDKQRAVFPGLSLAPILDGAFDVVVEYAPGGFPAEYDALRGPGSAGVIDRSDRALLALTGADRHAFLQGMVTNDVLTLAPGQSVRAALLDTTAHPLAFLRIHARPDALLLETDPRALPHLMQTLDLFLIMEDVTLTDVTEDWVCLSLRGKGNSDAVIALPPAHFTAPALEDAPGLDIWLPADHATAVWTALISTGVTPVGERAAETLRVESGLPAWGQELSETILLPEADLPDVISYTKGCYVGQEIIARLSARGHANRLLRGVLLEPGAPVPRPGDTVHLPEQGGDAGREIGRITSAVASPKFGGSALALAYIRREHADTPGAVVAVHIAQPGGTVFPFAGRILTRPFV